MNIFRYLRAMEARGIENLENLRKEQGKKDGKVKASDISTSDWERIRNHDELEKEFVRRKGKWQT